MVGRRHGLIALLAVGALFLGACSSNNAPSGGGGTPTGGGSSPTAGTSTTVNVTLQEYAVIPAQSSAPSGTVTFVVNNTGPAKQHELVVVQTSLAPDQLPKKADGSVDEAGTGVTAVGKIAAMAVGKTETKAFPLASGSYVLFCNVVETAGGTTTAHYTLGMRIGFTVS